jgi:hypothetical protein
MIFSNLWGERFELDPVEKAVPGLKTDAGLCVDIDLSSDQNPLNLVVMSIDARFHKLGLEFMV